MGCHLFIQILLIWLGAYMGLANDKITKLDKFIHAL